ncbi:MAG TPA: hypothetical protein DIW41_12420 [Lachnospiraceae bacterium]|jgi:hypothetical protein|nr:hypothetical protein [Lachnospiraceae bacterium]
MDTFNNPKAAIEGPYDDSLWDNRQWSMYDNQPYIFDKEICNNTPLKIVSGNIIKYYRCLMREPYEVKH